MRGLESQITRKFAKTVALAGLLHDLQKPVARLRANKSHEKLMAEKLRDLTFPSYIDGDLLVKMIEHHHYLRKEDKNQVRGIIGEEAWPYFQSLVIADHKVSGGTRESQHTREQEENRYIEGIYSKINILALIALEGDLDKKTSDKIWLGHDISKIFDENNMYDLNTARKYQNELKRAMVENVERCTNDIAVLLSRADRNEEFLSLTSKLDFILFRDLFTIPDSTYWVGSKNLPLVSLYTHSTLVSAVAYALARDLENGIIQREELTIEKVDAIDKPLFTLIVGDLHGIQSFISRVKNTRDAEGRGVLKRLAGRSALVDYITVYSAVHILKEFDLPWNSIIYLSGGRFTILSPILDKEKLREVEQKLNRILKAVTGFTMSITLWSKDVGFEKLTVFPLSPEELVDMAKQRYQQLEPINLENIKARKFCKICGSPIIIGENSYEEDICATCKLTEELGRRLLARSRRDGTSRVEIHAQSYPGAFNEIIDLMGITETDPILLETSYSTIDKILETTYIQLFGSSSIDVSTSDLKMVSKDGEEAWIRYSLDGLARISPAGKIGFTKGDVDNLGSILQKGKITTKHLPEESVPEEFKNAELKFSIAVFKETSKTLELFMKYWLPKKIIERDKYGYSGVVKIGNEPRTITNLSVGKFSDKNLGDKNNLRSRSVMVVYAGGDDFFLIGSWDSLLATMVGMQKYWRTCTSGNPHLTYTEANFITTSKHPVHAALRNLEELIEKAKSFDKKRKNKIVLFNYIIDHETLEEVLEFGTDLYLWGLEKHPVLPKKVDSSRLYNMHKILAGRGFKKTIREFISSNRHKTVRILTRYKLYYLFRDKKEEEKQKIRNFLNPRVDKLGHTATIGTSYAILKLRTVGGEKR